MRAVLEQWVRRWWAGELGLAAAPAALLAMPLSWLWTAVTVHRNAHADRQGGISVSGLAVVSVGNLAVGGTGKTPLASWVARTLSSAGHRPALLLSGYGADEVRLHERWTPTVPVLAGRDRVALARTAVERGADVAVLDDGFQHRRLDRDVDLVVLAAEDRFPGRLLPAGPYREPATALARATAVVVSRRTATLDETRSLAERVERSWPHLVTAGLDLSGGRWSTLEGEPAAQPEGDVLAVAAIGRPHLFRDTVAALVDGDVELLAFADHHDYRDAELTRIANRAAGRVVVVTEKDAVKWAILDTAALTVRVLAQDAKWAWGEDGVRAIVTGAVGESA